VDLPVIGEILDASPTEPYLCLCLELDAKDAASVLLDAATAGHRVGYESPSQFSREYRRLFGLTPGKDVQQRRA
jgi:AraC-like DNA-binding protein